jgi:hypothetical protein
VDANVNLNKHIGFSRMICGWVEPFKQNVSYPSGLKHMEMADFVVGGNVKYRSECYQQSDKVQGGVFC